MNNEARNAKVFSGTLVCILITTSPVFSQGKFTVSNDTNYFVELWVFRHASGSWKVFDLPRGREIELAAVTPGLCTLLAREPPRIDHGIGTYNLKEIVTANPNAVLRLRTALESSYKDREWRDRCGRRRRERIIITVHKMVPVWEGVGADLLDRGNKDPSPR
jgi:hypothetical protein